MGDEAEQRRRRRRGLLRMYYGASKDEDGKQKKKDPLDIDGDSFDGDAYLEKMFRTHHLQTIIDKEAKLNREIKALDSDMQTLVYENYNKFISATDTIRKMKTQVDGMEAEMQKLSENMQATAKLSGEITSTLRPRRQEISRLASGHVMLKKFQFLFELPARLRQCVDMGAIQQAVAYYSKASRVLELYRDVESFQGIYTSCREIMQALYRELSSKVEDPNTKLAEVRDTLPLLAKMGFDSEDTLASKLLHQAKKQWDADRAIQERNYKRDVDAFAADEERAVTGAAATEGDGTGGPENTAGSTDSAPAETAATEGAKEEGETERPQGEGEQAEEGGAGSTGIHSKGDHQQAEVEAEEEEEGGESEAEEGEPSSKPTTEQGGGNGTKKDRGEEGDAAAVATEAENADDASKRTTAASTQRGNRTTTAAAAAAVSHAPMAAFLTFIRKQLLFNLVEWIMCYQDIFLPEGHEGDEATKREEELSSFVHDLLKDDLLHSLRTKFDSILEWKRLTSRELCAMLQQVHQRMSTLASVVDGEAIKALGLAFVVDVTTAYSEQRRAAFLSELEAAASTALERSDDLSSLDTTVTVACDAIDDAYASIQHDFEALVKGKFAKEHPFFSTTFVNTHVRQELLLQSVIHLTSTLEHSATTNWRALLSYRIAYAWSSGALPKRVSCTLDAFSSGSKHKDELLKEEVLTMATKARKWLLNKFTQLSGTAFSKEMITSVREVALHDAPPDDLTAPSPRVTNVVKQLSELASKLASVMPTPKRAAKASLASFASRIQRDAVTNVHRLFSEAIQVFQEPKSKLDSVLSCVILIILKAFSEAIRECTLTLEAARQLQVDALFLHEKLAQFVFDDDVEGSVCALLAQAVNGVLRRTPEPPTLLDKLNA